MAVAAVAALSLGCGVNAGIFSGMVVGQVSNDGGTCIAAISPELQSAPGLVCLDHRIARKGDCVEIAASTPAVNNSKPLLFAGSLQAVLPRHKCSDPTPQS